MICVEYVFGMSSMLINELTQAAEQASTSVNVRNYCRLKLNSRVGSYGFPPLHNLMPLDVPAPLLKEVDTSSFYNHLRFIRGIVFSIVLSIPLWAGIATVVWTVLH